MDGVGLASVRHDIRQSALVTAASFGTIIGLASSSLPSQDWLDEVRTWRASWTLAKLASSFITLRQSDLTEIATTRLFVCLIRLFVWSVFASGAFPPDGHAATPGAKIARLAPRRGGAQFLWEIDASTDAALAPRKFLEIPSTHTYTAAVMS